MAKSSESPYSFQATIQFINNNFAIVLLLGIFFIAGFFMGSIWTENQFAREGGTQQAGQQAADAGAGGAQTPSVEEMPEITDADHIRGSRNAKIILVEYSDFECPFCARFHPTMQQVKDEFGDDVAWVYRHFPLTSLHPNAQTSAEVSECVADLAGEDGFWQFADAMADITSTDGRLSAASIEEAAIAAGVGQAQYQNCLDNDEYAAEVNEVLKGGAAAGITGTPGTILVTEDGPQELISGALPYEQVKAVIEQYL